MILGRGGHHPSDGAFEEMTHPRDYLPALDQIEAALEASCGALITLESLNTRATAPAGEADGVRKHTGQAMRSLREAIESLRAAQSDGADALALGFVMKQNQPAARPSWRQSGQPKPWRTA